MALVKDFFARHDCQSPLFIDIAAEFLDYLCREQASALDAMPFMLELAHYELLELQVSVAVDNSASWLEPTELQALEQLAAKLQLAVTARVAQYQFEVDRISQISARIRCRPPRYFSVSIVTGKRRCAF